MAIFLRYDGATKGPVLGRFTIGKVYIAQDDLESGGAKSGSSFHVHDDYGARLGFKLGPPFTQLESIYVCCTKHRPGTQYTPGEVDEATDAAFISSEEMDVDMLCLKQGGWQKANAFTIVDATVLCEGSYAMDGSGAWRRIDAVYQDLTVSIPGEPHKKPTDLLLPVNNGEVLTVPMLKCRAYTAGLTVGNEYVVESGDWWNDTVLHVKTDCDIVQPIETYNFAII